MSVFTKPNRTIKRIFIHCSDSDVKSHDDINVIKKWHVIDNLWSDIGYHYFITKTGEIQLGRDINLTPAAQKNNNKDTIAICLSGRDEFTQSQFNTLRKLCIDITSQYSYDIQIFGHRDVDNTKTCPNFEVKTKLNLSGNNTLIKEHSNMKKFWKKALSVVAPTIATAVGSPLAGTAIKLLSEELLGKPNGTEDEVAEAISKATPEQLTKLKDIEANFKLEMEKLNVDLENIAAKDRNSARRREIALKDSTPKILGALIMFGFFSLLGALLFYTVPEKNQDIFNIMLGALGTMATGVVTYYFGSSAGSRAKDIRLNK